MMAHKMNQQPITCRSFIFPTRDLISSWSLCLTLLLLLFSATQLRICGGEQTDLVIQNHAQSRDSSAQPQISTGADEDCVTSEEEAGSSISSFVQRNGSQFIVNGKPFYVNGGNFYWFMTVASNPSTKSAVTIALQEAANAGLNVGRCWAFFDGDYSFALQTSPGVYNEYVFQALDYAIAQAKKYGIRLILTLVDNWASYGGRPQYAAWANQSNPDTFYTNSTIKTWFKNYIKTMVTRVNTVTGLAYKNEPAIFAWELINEPECSSDPSGNTLQKWIAEMAPYLKSLDSNHLVEVGTEGFYGPKSSSREYENPYSYAAQVGTDFISDNQVLGIDFATFHAYPDIWLSQQSEAQMLVFMENWINAHIQDAQTKLNMPVVLTEFGKYSYSPNFTESVRDNFMATVYNTFYASAVQGGAGAGALVWQLLSYPIQSNYQDGYGIELSENNSTAAVMQNQSSRLAKLNKLNSHLF